MSSVRKIFLFVVLPLLVVFAVAFTYASRNQETAPATSPSSSLPQETKNVDTKAVTWSFDGNTWQSSDTAPACPEPLTLQTPVDLTQATAILYPGQTRNLYKPHGGFRFGNSQDNDITVTAPYDAVVTQASRYIEAGEVQYLFEFVNECGLAYRFDHLLTLAPKFQTLADQLPAAKVDDSRTTNLSPVAVAAGEVIATAVGFSKTKNVSVDFGVYDFRSPNQASQSASYKAAHQDQASLAFYGVCWLEMLSPENDRLTAQALPGGDQAAGKTSDYCR